MSALFFDSHSFFDDADPLHNLGELPLPAAEADDVATEPIKQEPHQHRDDEDQDVLQEKRRQLNDQQQQQHQQDDSFFGEPQQEEEEEDDAALSPEPVHSRSQPPTQVKNQPTSSPGPSDYSMAGMTAVDGFGMWNSWTRVFDEPKYAMLDLLDNCLDATLQPNFQGKVVMKKFEPNGICILNNSAKPIKPLKDVLVVYGSTKGVGRNAKRDAIGENGVGLKHGCATLSDSNFVITRNGNMYSLGVIAKSLQTKQGVCLPSAWFIIEDTDDKTPGEIEDNFHSHLSNIIGQNPKIGSCVQNALGQGDMNVGLKRLVEHCLLMWNDEWGDYDHIFQVIIASLIHSHNSITVPSRRSFHGNNPASLFLQEIKELLPKFYVNIPTKGFEFWIGEEKLLFSYWQHRLVELTKFTIHVPKETPIMDITHYNWDKQGYEINVFCGFEPLRLQDDNLPSTAQMYIYSRRSGRLIQHDDDARATLGLAASGTDYQQALTIIIDDAGAQLPLMPTKQGIAWSEQKGGETHKRNLFAWASGIADCYWKYHSNLFKKRCNTTAFKSMMQAQLLTFCDPIKRHVAELDLARSQKAIQTSASVRRSIAMERLGSANFSHFNLLEWKKSVAPNTKKARIRRKTYWNDVVPGDATIFKFTDEHYPDAAPVRRSAPPPAPVPAPAPVPPPAPAPVLPTRFNNPPQITQHQHNTRHAQLQQQHNRHAPVPVQRQVPRGPPPYAHHHPRVPNQMPHRMPQQPPHRGPQHLHAQPREHVPEPPQPRPEKRPAPIVKEDPSPLKRRRPSEQGTVGSVSNRPILLLDDDDEDEETEPVRQRRQTARKSTGTSQAPAARRRSSGSQNDNAHTAIEQERAEHQRRIANLERMLAAAQDEAYTSKRLLAASQVEHKETIQKFREDLERVKQDKQQRNGQQQHMPVSHQEELQRTQDELMITKRQKNRMAKEMQDIKEQRDEQVSGLNLEIETLKMRLEQHEETIRRLENSNSSEAADENVEPDLSLSQGWSPGRRSKYPSTDSI